MTPCRRFGFDGRKANPVAEVLSDTGNQFAESLVILFKTNGWLIAIPI